jgi:hypothetical protein
MLLQVALAYIGNLLHVSNHFIVALGLLAEPRKKRLTVGGVSSGAQNVIRVYLHTSHAVVKRMVSIWPYHRAGQAGDGMARDSTTCLRIRR